jgi:Family of unknown function (DUF5994)
MSMHATTKNDAGQQQQPQQQQQPVRLTLAPDLLRGSIDGAWWPRSHHVARELGSLAAAFPASLGRMTRVALPRAEWPDDHPWTVRREGPVLHVGWFAHMRPDTITICRRSGDRLTLLVIPPDTSEQAAEAAIGLATSGPRAASAAEILHQAGENAPELSTRAR